MQDISCYNSNTDLVRQEILSIFRPLLVLVGYRKGKIESIFDFSYTHIVPTLPSAEIEVAQIALILLEKSAKPSKPASRVFLRLPLCGISGSMKKAASQADANAMLA